MTRHDDWPLANLAANVKKEVRQEEDDSDEEESLQIKGEIKLEDANGSGRELDEMSGKNMLIKGENSKEIDVSYVTIEKELPPVKRNRPGEVKIPNKQPAEDVAPSLVKIKKEPSDEDYDEEQPPLKRVKKEEVETPKEEPAEEHEDGLGGSSAVEKRTSSEHAELSIDVSFQMRSMYFKVTVLSKEDPVKAKKMLMKIVANIKKEVKQEEDHSDQEEPIQIKDEIKLEDANDNNTNTRPTMAPEPGSTAAVAETEFIERINVVFRFTAYCAGYLLKFNRQGEYDGVPLYVIRRKSRSKVWRARLAIETDPRNRHSSAPLVIDPMLPMKAGDTFVYIKMKTLLVRATPTGLPTGRKIPIWKLTPHDSFRVKQAFQIFLQGERRPISSFI